MKLTDQLPQTSRGEVSVALGGKPRQFKFGMNVLRDYSKLVGKPAGSLGQDFHDDLQGTLLLLTYCAVRRYVPANELPADFTEDTVGDWLDDISEVDAESLTGALLQSVRTGNPMVAATLKQLTPPTPEPTTEV